VVKECEALAAADEARAAAAKREQGEDKTNREPSTADEAPTHDLGAFRCVLARARACIIDCWLVVGNRVRG
jgi:hypothetical protein